MSRLSGNLLLSRILISILILMISIIPALSPARAQTIGAIGWTFTGPTPSMFLDDIDSACEARTAWFNQSASPRFLLEYTGSVRPFNNTGTWECKNRNVMFGFFSYQLVRQVCIDSNNVIRPITSFLCKDIKNAPTPPVTMASQCPIGRTFDAIPGNLSQPYMPLVGNPVELASGAKIHEVEDYASADDNLSVTRYYHDGKTSFLFSSDFGLSWSGARRSFGYINPSSRSPLRIMTSDRFEIEFSLGTTIWPTVSSYPIFSRVVAEPQFITPATNAAWTTFFEQVPRSWLIRYRDGRVLVMSTVPDHATSTRMPVVVSSETLPNGYVINYSYGASDVNGNPKLNSATGSDGRVLTFTWSVDDFIERIDLPDGSHLKYYYNSTTGSSAQQRSLSKVERITATSAVAWSESYLYEISSKPLALTGIVDALGNRITTYSYNVLGQVTATGKADGSETTLIDYGAVVSGATSIARTVTNAAGKPASYVFATTMVPAQLTVSGARLSSVSLAATTQTPASSSTNTYSGLSVASNTNPRNVVESYGYDTLGRRVATTRAVGTPIQRAESATWETFFDKPAQEVRPGLTTSYTYDTQGRLLTRSETDTTSHTVPYTTAGQARTWTYAWTALGKLHSVNGPKAPNGSGQDDITSYAYDTQNNLISETNALAQVTSYSNYDANGRPGRMVSPAGLITDFSYDSIGRLTSRTVKHPTDPALDAVTLFAYDLAGQLTSVTLPYTAAINFLYSDIGRLIAVVDGSGSRIDYSYNNMGQIVEEETSASDSTIRQTISRTYDDLGRLVTEVLGPNRTYLWEYDVNNNPTRIIDARNNATQFAFDALDRLTTDTDPLNNAAQTGFDDQDDPISRTDRNGVETTFVRNGFGEVIQETSSDRGVSIYWYDAAGDVIQSSDGRGQIVNFDRDMPGRLVAKRPVGLSAQDVTYVWDSSYVGRLASIADSSGTTAYSYDHRGNITAKALTIGGGFSGTVQYAYDLADRVVQMTYPSGKIIDYARDSLGRVSQVSLRDTIGATPVMLASSLAYEPFGPPKAFNYGNTLVFTQDWGDDRRLYGKFIKRADTSNIWARTYTFDNDDNILSITTPGAPTATISYIYDPKSRLTRATGDFGPVQQEDYGYDDNDNRLSLEQRDVALSTTPTTVVTSAITAGTNRLASTIAMQGGSSLVRTLTYNGRGDIASELRDSVAVTTSYDAYGRLTSYARAGTSPQSMLYSGSDERVEVTTDATPRRYVYDESGRLIGQYGATGTIHAEHIWLMPDTDEGGWEPLALLEPSTLSYVHGDHLGVPVLITDASGNTVNAMQAEPFGRRFYTASTSAPRTGLAFPGQIIDIADRHYNLYRDYDPTLGRYLQADPIGLDGGDNVYGYVGGNPVKFVDPNGLNPVSAAILACEVAPAACATIIAGIAYEGGKLVQACIDGGTAQNQISVLELAPKRKRSKRGPSIPCSSCGTPHGGVTGTTECKECDTKRKNGNPVKGENPRPLG